MNLFHAIRWIQFRGLAVALLGFGITRFFVAEALVIEMAISFFIVGLLPLVVGLGLTIYGVALSIGNFSSDYVTSVSNWCFLGTVVMIGVIGLSLVDSLLQGHGLGYLGDANTFVANVVLAGAIGGVLIGDRSAKNRREREENRRQANRALLVIRLLRHDVINAAAIIDGHADLLMDTDRPRSLQAIKSAISRIRSTVEEIGAIAERETGTGRVDLSTVIEETVSEFEAENPGVTIVVRDATTDPLAAVDQRISIAIQELLENAVIHGRSEEVLVELRETSQTTIVSVHDDGPGLPDRQRELLTSGEFPEYDDPSAGFGLQFVRLLVHQYNGRVRISTGDVDSAGSDDASNTDEQGETTLDQTDSSDGDVPQSGKQWSPGSNTDGTTISLELPRKQTADPFSESISVPYPDLYRAAIAGLGAGIFMGLFFQLTSGLLPVIGALYGTESQLIGWITHLFHSVVFGLLFAAGCSRIPSETYANHPLGTSVLGFVWGTFLWLVAAGLLMPVWLSLVGVPSALPNLPPLGFFAHGLWGVVLGLTYWGLGRIEMGGLEDQGVR